MKNKVAPNLHCPAGFFVIRLPEKYNLLPDSVRREDKKKEKGNSSSNNNNHNISRLRFGRCGTVTLLPRHPWLIKAITSSPAPLKNRSAISHWCHLATSKRWTFGSPPGSLQSRFITGYKSGGTGTEPLTRGLPGLSSIKLKIIHS